jgi:selenide,water dikinase
MIAVDSANKTWFEEAMKLQNQVIWEIGRFKEKGDFVVEVIQ